MKRSDIRTYFRNGRAVVSDETYAIVKTKRALAGSLAVIKDDRETTCIISESKLGSQKFLGFEGDWRMITFDMVLPLSLVGFFAAVSTALADAEVNLFAISATDGPHLRQGQKSRRRQGAREAGPPVRQPWGSRLRGRQPLAEIRKVLGAIDPAAHRRLRRLFPGRGRRASGRELVFDDPPGDVHSSTATSRRRCPRDQDRPGFVENPKQALSGDGLMLVFSPEDRPQRPPRRGYLTNLRTAVAGAVVARSGPAERGGRGHRRRGVRAGCSSECCGGSDVRPAVVWGSTRELAAYRRDVERPGLTVRTTLRAEEVAAAANLIVTCTPSTTPLLEAAWIRRGTHITAVGSDTAAKQELDPAILAQADRIVVDSLSQSELRGEAYRAVSAGAIGRDRLVELGRVVEDPALRRSSDAETTVADLTGVAVQDIQISKAVWQAISRR
jgi:ornithine cyclodeaminase